MVREVVFVVFMWSLWLLYGCLIIFENSSRIYRAADDAKTATGLVMLLIVWGCFLVFSTLDWIVRHADVNTDKNSGKDIDRIPGEL